MPTVIRKAFAYITHADRLLVFRHPGAPDAGIQVPAGTIRDGERPADAALREARQETGLADLILVRFLGERRRDLFDFGKAEIHNRFFFHLRCGSEPPTTWRHDERDPSDGAGPITFELFWARLPDGVPSLIAGHDALLPDLITSLVRGGLPGQFDAG